MADVIELLSSDEEENDEPGFISPTVTLEPVKKKQKLENGDVNVIVLTDEEDCATSPEEPTITLVEYPTTPVTATSTNSINATNSKYAADINSVIPKLKLALNAGKFFKNGVVNSTNSVSASTKSQVKTAVKILEKPVSASAATQTLMKAPNKTSINSSAKSSVNPTNSLNSMVTGFINKNNSVSSANCLASSTNNPSSSANNPSSSPNKINLANFASKNCPASPANKNNPASSANNCSLSSTNKGSVTTTTPMEIVDLDLEENSDNSSKENISTENATPTANGCEYTPPKELESFVAVCRLKISDPSTLRMFNTKVPILVKACKKAQEYVKSEKFREMMAKSAENVKEGRRKVGYEFQEVFQDIRGNYDYVDKQSRKLQNLYSLLEKLHFRTLKLETAEVDFDEEDDSSYIKMQKFRERAALVFKKIKELEGENHHQGSVYYSRLDFSNSSHPEINRAITKKFSDREKIPFPTLQDVTICIRKCAKQHDLKLSEGQLKAEIHKCFEKLGDLIQRKRRQDLAYVHHMFLDNVNAPELAPEVEQQLNERKRKANEATDRITQNFTRMQETGENPDVSSDSDDSNRPDTDVEDDL